MSGGVLIRGGTILIVIDGGGAAITTGTKLEFPVPFACTVKGWVIVADQSGSIVVDIKRSAYNVTPSYSSIAGSEKPTLSTAVANRDKTLTTWTTALAVDDILQVIVDSATTVTRAEIAIEIN